MKSIMERLEDKMYAMLCSQTEKEYIQYQFRQALEEIEKEVWKTYGKGQIPLLEKLIGTGGKE